MRLLALDAALDGCSVALMVDGVIVAEHMERRSHGQAEALPRLVATVLRGDRRLDMVAATVGPGRFTGLRAALGLAEGLAIAAGARRVGLTVPEAIRRAVARPQSAAADCWVALQATRDRLYLDRGQGIELLDRADWPSATARRVAGDAAALLIESGGGGTVVSTDMPLARALALVVAETHHDDTDLKPFVPLYVDAPVVRPAPMRPPPGGA